MSNIANSASKAKGSLHAQACALAVAGIPVFPCEPNGKNPACPHGFKDATTNLVQIDAWWEENPSYNIAIYPEAAGYAVVDVDPGAPANWALGDLPKTYTVATPRGFHLYFKGSLPPSASKLALHVDTRGRDSYVLVPPSVVNGKVYTVKDDIDLAELPGWIVEKLAAPDRTSGLAAPSVDPDLPINIKRAIADIHSDLVKHGPPVIGEGSDNRTYVILGQLKDDGISLDRGVDLLMEHWAPYFERDWLDDKARNVWNYGQNPPGAHALRPLYDTFRGASPGLPLNDNEDDAWPEPIDVFGGALTPEPVLTRDMLPEVITEVAFDTAERIGTSPAAVGLNMLAVVGSVLHSDIKIQPKQQDEWAQPGYLWVVTIAPPGTRKTDAQGAAIAPLADLDRDAFMRHRQAEGLHKMALAEFKGRLKLREDQRGIGVTVDGPLDPVEPPAPKMRLTLANDATLEKLQETVADNGCGLCVASDELAALIGSFDVYRNGKGGKDRASYLSFYEGRSLTVSRVGRGHIHIPVWGGSILGNIQPDRLAELAPSLATDGFLQRAVLIEAERLPDQDRKPNQEAAREFADTVSFLAKIEPLPGTIRLSRGAHREYLRVKRVVEAIAEQPGIPVALQGHLFKMAGLYARITLSMHAIECAGVRMPPSPEVGAETAAKARRLVLRFLLPSAMRIYARYFTDKGAWGDAQEVGGTILAHGRDKISRRDIRKAYRAARDDEHVIDRAMDALANAGWVRPAEGEIAGMVEKWTVNPKVNDGRFAERARQEQARRRAVKEKIVASGKIIAEEYDEG